MNAPAILSNFSAAVESLRDTRPDIVFQNPGLIDMAAVTTMGVSVKGAGAIGYFGTGLKFAIATILREGCSLTIYRGTEQFTFTVDPIEVRGEHFDRVCMNGEPLGFTTQLGRDWEPWMAFRELASNCRDEGGSCFRSADWAPNDVSTTIVVNGLAMETVWPERRSIMLEGVPLLRTDTLEIYEGDSQFVYYRGVRICAAPRPLTYTYNLLDVVELTEDRTAKGGWSAVEYKLERGIGAIEERSILRRIMTCGEVYAEHHMDVPEWGSPGPVFREIARELALGAATELRANPAAVRMARQSAVADMREGDSVALDAVQSHMLNKAKAMLERGGYKIDSYPVIICDTLGPNIHGLAKDGRIFLSLLPFDKGTREVAATLLEEYAHLKSGQGDHTPGFQNWLFDQLLVQAERVAGEPF